jgi:GDPmannose 4,6-dehydratase
MIGNSFLKSQNENTFFNPQSPYAISKIFAHYITKNYRDSYGIFACSGICFNHESPLRGENFVTRKISKSLSEIKLGLRKYLELGNLDSRRDWGYAKDYVDGMWRMLQADNPDTYILSTNRTQTVRDFVTMAAKYAGFNIVWNGSKEKEVGLDKATGKILIRVNPVFYRPAEVDLLIGNANKAKIELGWEAKTDLEALCMMMVETDIDRNKKGFSFIRSIHFGISLVNSFNLLPKPPANTIASFIYIFCSQKSIISSIKFSKLYSGSHLKVVFNLEQSPFK